MVVLVHGRGVEAEIASGFIVVVAGCSEGDFGTNTMSSKSSRRDSVFVHKASDVV